MSRRARHVLQLTIALVAALGGAYLMKDTGPLFDEEPTAHAQRLSLTHHVHVAFGDPAQFYVAPYTKNDAHIAGIEMEVADRQSASIALSGVETALRQYPTGFVAKLIRGVFVAGKIRVGSVAAGGTVGPAWIILAAPSRLGRSGIFASSVVGVHHELSSFVLRYRGDTLSRWSTFLPEDWHPQRTPEAKIAMDQQPNPSPSTGFLSSYGATDAENDFNVYAETIFTDPQSVAKAASEHQIVRDKLAFVLAAYADVDPRMSPVFHALRLQ